MTAYQKRKQERDEARAEVNRLRRLIHDNFYNQSGGQELFTIALEVKSSDDWERLLWMGERTIDK